MEQVSLQKIRELASLLLTPEQIGDLLGLSTEERAQFLNPFSEIGRMYRLVLAEEAQKLHKQTLELAPVGSPTALEKAAEWLQRAQSSIE